MPASLSVPAASISQHLAARFAPVQPEGLSASAQYLLDQGPHLLERALTANGGITFSFMDQLHFMPLSQMLLRMADPAAIQAGAPTVSPLPALPTTSSTPAASQQLPATQQLPPLSAGAMLCTDLEEPGLPYLVEPAQQQLPSSSFPAAASQQLPVPTATAVEQLVQEVLASASPAPAPAMQPLSSSTAAVRPADLRPLNSSLSGTCPAAASQWLPSKAPTAMPTAPSTQPLPTAPAAEAAAVWYTPEELVQEALVAAPAPAPPQPSTSTAAPEGLLAHFRGQNWRALAARRDSLRSHGILDQVPHVTPVTLLPGLSPLEYLLIQEMDTERPANDWTIAIYDTGADCALCSPAFAQRNHLSYGANSIRVNTADGSSSNTLGELDHPLEFWLAKSSAHPCRAVSTVQVMAGVDKLFDLLISTEIITQWTAHICCMSGHMVYYPDFWTKGVRTGARRLPIRLCRPEPSDEEQAAE